MEADINNTALSQLGRITLSDIWNRICLELRKSVGEDDFRNWISKVRFTAIDGGVVIIEAPTQFTGEWILQTYGDKILDCFKSIGEKVVRLNYVVVKPNKLTDSTPSHPEEVTKDNGSTLPVCNLVSRFTFDQFVVGNPNAVAYAAAKRVADDKEVTFSPLFLYGGVGLGKTHLMNSVGWALKEKNPKARVIYLSAEQFMYLFVDALRSKSVIEFKKIFRSVELLMVDDIQFIAGKNSTQEEFFHTFNVLAAQRKKIILTADRSPGKIEGLEERVRSRLQSGLSIELHPADYELRLGILQQKVEFMKEKNSSLRFEKGVLEFLAHRITRNARILEGALNRLVATQSFMNTPITVEYAMHILQDMLREVDRKVRLDDIIKCVSKHYNLKSADLIGARRTREIARPRQVAIYLAKNLTTRSLPDIGRAFNRDHTTVIHSVRRVEELILQDTEIAGDIEILQRRLVEYNTLG